MQYHEAFLGFIHRKQYIYSHMKKQTSNTVIVFCPESENMWHNCMVYIENFTFSWSKCSFCNLVNLP